MDDKPSFRPFIFPAIVLILGGGGGLAALLLYTQPTTWARWGLFALLIIAFSGLTIPISYAVNRVISLRFEPVVVARQSLWVGLYASILAWLQIPRLLTFNLGLWLAIGILVIEYLIRWREQVIQAAENPEK